MSFMAKNQDLFEKNGVKGRSNLFRYVGDGANSSGDRAGNSSNSSSSNGDSSESNATAKKETSKKRERDSPQAGAKKKARLSDGLDAKTTAE